MESCILCLWMLRKDFGSSKQTQILWTLLSFVVLECRKGNALVR